MRLEPGDLVGRPVLAVPEDHDGPWPWRIYTVIGQPGMSTVRVRSHDDGDEFDTPIVDLKLLRHSTWTD